MGRNLAKPVCWTSPLCPTVSGWAYKYLFTTCLLFLFWPINHLLSFWIPRARLPLLSAKWHMRLNCPMPLLVSYSYHIPTCIFIVNFAHILLLICLMLTWLLAHIEKFRRRKENYILTSTLYCICSLSPWGRTGFGNSCPHVHSNIGDMGSPSCPVRTSVSHK